MSNPLLPQSINWANVAVRFALIVVTWVVVWILIRYVGRWVTRFFERVSEQTSDQTGLGVLRSLLDAVVITLGALLTLGLLGLTSAVTSLLTAAGVAGLIIGFAVKDVAANLISGILLLTDRPFSLGDVVSAANIQGTVENIALRSTRIRTVDGPVVTIPNSVIAAGAITNFSVNPNRRFELIWTLPLDADGDQAKRILLEIAAAEARLAPGVLPQVLMGDIRNGSFDLRLICQAPNALWTEVQSDLRRALVARAREHDLPAGLPAQIVHTPPVGATTMGAVVAR